VTVADAHGVQSGSAGGGPAKVLQSVAVADTIQAHAELSSDEARVSTAQFTRLFGEWFGNWCVPHLSAPAGQSRGREERRMGL